MIRINLNGTTQSFTVDKDLAKRFDYITSQVSFSRQLKQTFLTFIFGDEIETIEIKDETIYQELLSACENLIYFITSTNMDDYLVLNRLGYNGALYDPIYLSIYNEEKEMRHIKDLDGCFDLSEIDFDTFEFEFDEDDIMLNQTYKTQNKMSLQETEEQQSKISPVFEERVDSYNPEHSVIHPQLVGRDDNRPFENVSYLDRFLGLVPVEYLPFITLAGGAVLKSYCGKSLESSDIDVFFHSCDKEKAYEILEVFETISIPNTTSNSPNVISMIVRLPDYRDVNVQFILRLYNSPSEIILGFDVDSSCILYDSIQRKYYGTKRFIYAHLHKMNTVNFDRMSPSYEYRLKKFVDRGYGVYIPGYEILTRSLILDQSLMKGASILLNHTMTDYNKPLSDYLGNPDKFHYNMDSIENIVFKVQNPGEQAMGTFHRLVYDNPQEWYGHADVLPNFVVPDLDNTVIGEYEFNQLIEEKERNQNVRWKNVLTMIKPKKLRFPDMINQILLNSTVNMVAVGVTGRNSIDGVAYQSDNIFAIVGSDNFSRDYNLAMMATKLLLIEKFLPMFLGFDVFHELNLKIDHFMTLGFITNRDVVEYIEEGSMVFEENAIQFDEQGEEISNSQRRKLNELRPILANLNQTRHINPDDETEYQTVKSFYNKVKMVDSWTSFVPKIRISVVNYRTMEQVISHQKKISDKVVMVGSPEGGKFYMGELTKSSIVNQINYEPLDDMRKAFYRYTRYGMLNTKISPHRERKLDQECRENSYGYIVDRKEYIIKALNRQY